MPVMIQGERGGVDQQGGDENIPFDEEDEEDEQYGSNTGSRINQFNLTDEHRKRMDELINLDDDILDKQLAYIPIEYYEQDMKIMNQLEVYGRLDRMVLPADEIFTKERMEQDKKLDFLSQQVSDCNSLLLDLLAYISISLSV